MHSTALTAACAGALALLLVAGASACGGRDGLWVLGGEGGGGGAGGSSASSSSSSSGTGGDVGPPPPCAYQSAGDAVVVMGFDDRHASSPSLATTVAGDPGASARVAVQALASGGSSSAHPDVRLAEVRIGDSWPEGLLQTQPPVLAGDESHSWAEMARAPGAGTHLALSWYSDPGMVGRVAFRTFDITSWSPGNKVDIDLDGEVALALVAGAAVGDMGIGYAGDGYGLVWRRRVPPNSQPLVGVLDLDGQLLLGPHPVAEMAEARRSPSAVWSGQAYLMATAFGSCQPGEALCVPHAVVITRVRPASGDAWDDSGVDLVAAVSVDKATTSPRRPAIASYQGRVWIAWGEGPPGDVPLSMRMAALDPGGSVAVGPIIIAEQVRPSNRPALVATDQGVSLIWLEPSGDDGPPDQLGAADVVVVAMDHDLTPLAPVLRLPITMPQLGIPSAVTVREPRSLLVGWSGLPLGGGGFGLDVAYLARFDCAPPAR